MFGLTDKNALVTGASGGIGGEIAKVLHAQGATVTLSGTRVEALDALAQDLGDRVHVIAARLGEEGAAEALAKEAVKVMGSVDILVNNAGLTRDGLAMRMMDEDWQQVIDVNLTASFQLIRTCLRGMMKARWGRIVSISSVVGVMGNPGQINYVASKAGMIGMSKSLAQEVANRGITVNCVAPGFIESPMTDALTDDQKEKIMSGIPVGAMGTAQDVANSVLYLVSQEAAYITGQTLHVNGGMAMI